MNTSKIKIKTRLHDGINPSCGGGATRVHYSFNCNARNLLKAESLLSEHYLAMERSFGSVGHQGSWIEINGNRVDSSDLFWLDKDTYSSLKLSRHRDGLSCQTRTELAQDIIDNSAKQDTDA